MSRYSPRNILDKEPAAISGAVVVILNGLALFGVVDVSIDQLAGVNVAVATLLTLFTRSSVSPVR